jgi:hypothetical protein
MSTKRYMALWLIRMYSRLWSVSWSTQFGASLSTMILSMRILLALSCFVPMVLRGVYFRGSSPIRLIILRSILLYHVLYLSLYIHYRIILATIKFLGNCLCPLCTCVKEKVRDLGTKADDRRRSAIRVDSEERQNMVERAREWIFQRGRAVTSEAINNYLGFSMTPIRVIPSPGQENILLIFLLECILSSTMWSPFQFLSNVCPRSPSWIRTWCLETCIRPPGTDSLCL